MSVPWVRRSRTVFGVFMIAAVTSVTSAVAQAQDIPLTADGRPDLSGTYDVASLTPLQRPVELGDRFELTEEEAAELAVREQARRAARNRNSDPDRDAPPVGGDGSAGASGNVGGYNSFWIDRGSGGFQIDGQWRTSIIVDPDNGRRPALTPEGQRRARVRAERRRPNTGRAWWLETDLNAPGPYDDPELRPLAERCLLGFGSTSGPPMLPVLYNNLKKVIQTQDHVMILVEMVHDARIIRLNQEHAPPDIRKWLGDSVGHWEGDTLVVDTTNFGDSRALTLASRDLHVVERFTRVDDETLLYQFTVDDPTIWTAPWSGEYIWPSTTDRVYEYACHEANYSLGGILRGARILEAEARGEQPE